jgi:eukaryotic-like serine/threonine-protein kinase
MDTPAQLGKYVITATLGRGAMGVVYKAFDPNIRRVVALKAIVKEPGVDEASHAASRFKNEAQAAGRLSHPGIVAVYDYGEDAGVAYIAMEFVEGHDLGEYAKQGVRFEVADVVSLMTQLLDALQYALDQGVIHRDIKPANIIVTNDGRVKVADFGVARIEVSDLTQYGMVIGTPCYMAPEQHLGLGVDRRADIFSAGAVLFQLLTGERPYQGSYEQLAYRICHGPVPSARAVAPDRVTPEVEAVLHRALACERDDRYPSARAFREALQAAYAAPVASVVSKDTLSTITATTRLPFLPRLPGGGSSGSLPPPGWDEALLQNVVQQLARFVGPLAKVLVRKAAARTKDLDGLYGQLASELDSDDDRRAFLAARASARPAVAAVSRGGPSTPQPSVRIGHDGVINADVVDRAARELAPYLGPMAKVIATRTATRALSRHQFYLLLAEELDPSDRGGFLRAVNIAG